MVDHEAMKAYSEDLRKKVVEAVSNVAPLSPKQPAFSASASPRSSVTPDSPTEESPLAQGREAEDPPKLTTPRGSSSRRTYAQDRLPPSKRGAASWKASPARASASPL